MGGKPSCTCPFPGKINGLSRNELPTKCEKVVPLILNYMYSLYIICSATHDNYWRKFCIIKISDVVFLLDLTIYYGGYKNIRSISGDLMRASFIHQSCTIFHLDPVISTGFGISTFDSFQQFQYEYCWTNF